VEERSLPQDGRRDHLGVRRLFVRVGQAALMRPTTNMQGDAHLAAFKRRIRGLVHDGFEPER
jgi:hypothetical protein